MLPLFITAVIESLVSGYEWKPLFYIIRLAIERPGKYKNPVIEIYLERKNNCKVFVNKTKQNEAIEFNKCVERVSPNFQTDEWSLAIEITANNLFSTIQNVGKQILY